MRKRCRRINRKMRVRNNMIKLTTVMSMTYFACWWAVNPFYWLACVDNPLPEWIMFVCGFQIMWYCFANLRPEGQEED